MKRIVIKILGVLLIGIIIAQTNITIAASKTELTNSASETDQKIKQAQEELEGIQGDKSEAMNQVETLIGQISDYENQIAQLDNQIGDLNTKIEEAQNNLNKKQEDYDKQEELLEARLVSYYMAGDTSYLDYLLTSKSITDFISNYYLVSELAQTDMELLDTIQKQKEEIENAKTQLENSKNELATSKASKQSVATQLQASKNQKDQYVAQLTEQEKQTQAELEQFERDKKEIQAELAEIARQEEEARKNSNNGTVNDVPEISNPSASGYVFPVAGLSKANINNKNYPSYPGHTGVDVNINVSGKTIVAVKDGTVTRSKAYISNGKYYSYGECIVINHHDGTATLYAHGLPGSRRVSQGDTVKQGQPIMTVGTTGNSSGEHLHFEVLVNGIPVNPLPYLP